VRLCTRSRPRPSLRAARKNDPSIDRASGLSAFNFCAAMNSSDGAPENAGRSFPVSCGVRNAGKQGCGSDTHTLNVIGERGGCERPSLNHRYALQHVERARCAPLDRDLSNPAGARSMFDGDNPRTEIGQGRSRGAMAGAWRSAAIPASSVCRIRLAGPRRTQNPQRGSESPCASGHASARSPRPSILAICWRGSRCRHLGCPI